MSKQQWIKENLKPGEQYAGLILGKYGAEDYHLVLLSAQARNVTWRDARKCVKTMGGELPTLREFALLLSNLEEQFESRSYWSIEALEVTPGFFGELLLNRSHKKDKFCARAIRRLPLGGE